MAAQKNANIHLFFGEDTYSILHELKRWQDSFNEKHGGELNMSVLEGKKIEFAEFQSNVESVPFLSEKRLVIVKNFIKSGNSDTQKKIAKLLEDGISDFCIILFIETEGVDKRTAIYKKLNKVGNLKEFKLLIGPDLTKWILNKSQEVGLNIDTTMATYLWQIAGQNLWTISNEIQKLKLYLKDKPVDRNAIHQLVHPNLSTSIFKLTDSLAAKHSKDVIETFHILLESGEDLMKVFFMLVRHFRILIQVKDLKNQGLQRQAIISKLKQHPFVIGNMEKQANNFSIDDLIDIYGNFLKIDIRIKTGLIRFSTEDKRDFELALEEVMLGVCK